jgi:hypothetical protein
MSNQLSYTTFQDNFLTQIRAVETGHTDETGTYDYGVGFNVICKLNNRVMYFEDHLSSTILPQSYTDQDIVNSAWSNIVPVVKTWASSALVLPNLIGTSWTPSNVSFDIGVYNSNFDTYVSRFEVYPPTDPKSWAIGFKINQKNRQNIEAFFDTQVTVNTFAIFRAEEEILTLAFDNLYSRISTWTSQQLIHSSLVNSEYVGSSNVW